MLARGAIIVFEVFSCRGTGRLVEIRAMFPEPVERAMAERMRRLSVRMRKTRCLKIRLALSGDGTFARAVCADRVAYLVPGSRMKPFPLPCVRSELLRTAFLQDEWGDAECGLSVFTKSVLPAYGKAGPSWCVCLRKSYFAAERDGYRRGTVRGVLLLFIYSVWPGDRSVYERIGRCRQVCGRFRRRSFRIAWER